MKIDVEYVVFADNAVKKIVGELRDNVLTETGGILLGYREEMQWIVTEMISPGPNAIREKDVFEFDTEYVNEVCNVYLDEKNPKAELLGIWHKHIGKNSKFSQEDIEINKKIVFVNNKSIISGIITTYPKYCLKLYYVDFEGVNKEVKHNLNKFV